tara:strand:- start:5482 stop:6549 length:1068 start_codon:yes stop_codon:yes gene_type:complete
MNKFIHSTLTSFLFILNNLFSQCDSLYSYYDTLPQTLTVLVGDSCFYDRDIEVLDSLISINNLEYNSPLELGTQTWLNGRIRFLVAGNYGNGSGVNDTIFTLPDNIGHWDALASLYLEWNRISILPSSFSQMTGLQSFYINNNILRSLNSEFGNLSNLFLADLGYNELDSLPESICSLSNITYLWLFNNNLTSLPDCFCELALDWNNSDIGGYPYFAIGGNKLCESLPACVSESENLELSLDQFYYSFPVFSPQDCGQVSVDEDHMLESYLVSNPFPNPFNPETSIQFSILADTQMNITVLNSAGKEVATISQNEFYKKGAHAVTWNAKGYASGIYFLLFSNGLNMELKKLMLIK